MLNRTKHAQTMTRQRGPARFSRTPADQREERKRKRLFKRVKVQTAVQSANKASQQEGEGC